MLQSLHVKNIALLDEVEVDFTDGLNILTGETGAGKSIIIDSVNFALGSRMPKDVVRDDSEYALCELVFSVEDEETVKALAALDVIPDDGQVILQRKIVNGKSTCRMNGETVTASAIRNAASFLIDIHGQHEHQSLLDRKNHKTVLDSFCGDGLRSKLCKLQDIYDSYKEVEREYDRSIKSRDSVREDLDYSLFVANEIEAANLAVGEDEALESDFKRMNNSLKIAEILSGVSSALASDGECASAMIGYAASGLKQIAELDDEASPLYDQMTAAEDMIADCVREISAYEEKLEFSREDHEKARARLDTINSLKMKYGKTIEDILERLSEESRKIEKLSDFDGYLSELGEKKQKLYEKLKSECLAVSDIRRSEAQKLQKDLAAALNNLNFLDAKFEISIKSDESGINRDGFDDVEFMISTNPGEDLKPLTNVASGGELSRIMLALKSVLAKRDNIGTMIFDEIDTGISGRTAQLVADRMSEIAKSHQVIAVTHLPQIASHADTHFLIEKTAVTDHTSTSVRSLSYDESVEELARMLAGDKITEAVRINARELKEKK